MKTAARMMFVLILIFLTTGGGSCSSQGDLTLNLSGSNDVRVPPVTGVNTNFSNSIEKLGNNKVWNAIEQAKFPVLRFPGGSQSNLYNWRTGNLYPGSKLSPRSREHYEATNTVPMDDFMRRSKNVGASVSYVLNIMDSPRSVRELARHWKSTKAPVHWVEMGNEYYLPDLAKSIGGPEGYLRRARQALSALRAGGYDGPVGLVAAPEGVPGRERHRNEFRSWNEKLAGSKTSGFSAIILHYYPSPKQPGFDHLYEKGPPTLIAVTRKLRNLFRGKQIWITEWNHGKPATIPESNTLWHALFDLRMLQAMLVARVDLASYHVLTGRGWELLGTGNSTQHSGSGDVTGLSRRVPYFVFQMVNEAESDGAVYMSGLKPTGGVMYMAFHTNKELRIVAWTSTKQVRNIKVKADAFSTKFLGGELLQGNLGDTNGSSMRKNDKGASQGEKVKPVPISSPQIRGPGAVFLRFSLKSLRQ